MNTAQLEFSPPLDTAALHGLADTHQRWQVLYQQLRSGREPCFRTELRLTCTDMNCALRASCVGLRATWRR